MGHRTATARSRYGRADTSALTPADMEAFRSACRVAWRVMDFDGGQFEARARTAHNKKISKGIALGATGAPGEF